MSLNEKIAKELEAELAPLQWKQRIEAIENWSNKLEFAFGTSFSFEDQAITHVIATAKQPVYIFTIDTGRLFEETHEVHDATVKRYGIEIDTFYPKSRALQDFVTDSGINSFYDSVDNRKRCCHIRKVEPLDRALGGVDVWISGLRREHSDYRADIKVASWDERRDIVHLHPLFDVGENEIWSFIREHQVPINSLHDKGFPSIGCKPCTRAVAAGENPRSGRWWWEQGGVRECGLHIQDGKFVRSKNPDYADNEELQEEIAEEEDLRAVG